MNSKPPLEEELVYTDDRVIGRALRWSAVAFVALVLAGTGGYLVWKRKPAPAPSRLTKLAAPTVPERPQAEIPVARFSDITQESGVAFIHNNGAYGEKLLPETMGGGVAFLDYDNDGYQDSPLRQLELLALACSRRQTVAHDGPLPQ